VRNKKNIVLFDGICNLCNSAVDFILRRDRKNQFRFVSIQSQEGQKLIARFKIPDNLDSVIMLKGEIVYTESEAAIEIAKMLPTPWKWTTIFRFVPLEIRNGIYRWIAKNRYHWFGKRDQCRIIQN